MENESTAAMDLTEDQPTSSTTKHQHQHQHEHDDTADGDVVIRNNDSTTFGKDSSSSSTSNADGTEREAQVSWLREDCLDFYRNELLSSSSSSSSSSSKKPITIIAVKERISLLRHGIVRAMGVKKRFPDALFLEFGVHEGKDLVRMAAFLRSIEERQKPKADSNDNTIRTYTRFHGFDSFEGLPEDWINGQMGANDEPYHKKGAFDTGGSSPDVEHLIEHQLKLRDHGRSQTSLFATDNNIVFHKGWFHESLPPFLDSHSGISSVAFVHADADLYTSTITFLRLICERKLFRKGSVIVFDEFWNYPHWEDGEFKAWMEIADDFGLEYEYFGYHARPPNVKKFKHYGYQSVGVVITSDMD
mmetsp:Transcript_6594/g.9444  ORF Transcript_6594/g.9444 Transcript_6594/m.9444 type:complete len:360 (-) Transcript_6594:93-1172(-)